MDQHWYFIAKEAAGPRQSRSPEIAMFTRCVDLVLSCEQSHLLLPIPRQKMRYIASNQRLFDEPTINELNHSVAPIGRKSFISLSFKNRVAQVEGTCLRDLPIAL
jgi:hypothetical protein